MLPTPPPSPTHSTCAPEDRLGLVLGGEYRLDTILGVGAYGTVYVARQLVSGRDFAIKALNKVGLDARQRRFQQREIQLHHAVSHHPNVVSLFQVLEADDATYVVMEYCPEGDLFASITEQMFYTGNDELIRTAFLQVLDAVAFCHANGIYHRDLKPENILVTDGGYTLKLADFGLATRDHWTSDYGCGSTFYMSSECQVANPTAQSFYASAPNDVWALGVLLINLACGRNPWRRASSEDSTFRAFLKDSHFLSTILPISHELETILRRVFDCNPHTRISLSELRRLVIGCKYFTAQSQQARPPTPELIEYDVPQPAQLPQAFDVKLPPSPPLTPPAQARFSPPALPPTFSPWSCYVASHGSLIPRIPATGALSASSSTPVIISDELSRSAHADSWNRPLGYHSPASLVSA